MVAAITVPPPPSPADRQIARIAPEMTATILTAQDASGNAVAQLATMASVAANQ